MKKKLMGILAAAIAVSMICGFKAFAEETNAVDEDLTVSEAFLVSTEQSEEAISEATHPEASAPLETTYDTYANIFSSPEGTPPEYDSTKAYPKGERVVYNGKIYEAKWYVNPGDAPSDSEWGAWKYISDATLPESSAPVITSAIPAETTVATSAPDGNGSIVLDGLYDDWIDKPKAELTYDGNDGQRQNYISAYRDGDVIYFYALIRSNGYFDGSNFHLKSDSGKDLSFGATSSAGSTPPIGSTTDLTIRDNGWNYLGSGYLNMREGLNEMEFGIDVNSLIKMGWTESDLRNLTFSNTSYGKGSITIHGTSTGAAVAVLLGLATAAAGLIIYNKKNKKDDV